MGTAAAMFTAHKATQRNIAQSRLELAVTSYGEVIKNKTFTSCASTSTYRVDNGTTYDPDGNGKSEWVPPDGVKAAAGTITGIEYAAADSSGLIDADSSVAGTQLFGPTCPTSPTRNVVQRISYELQWVDGATTRTVKGEVVKADRKACASWSAGSNPCQDSAP